MIAEIERFGRDELHRNVVRNRGKRRKQTSRGDVRGTADECRKARSAATRVDELDG